MGRAPRIGVPGHGQQSGPLRPDWGDGWADLTCDTCQAGWTGPIGEPCAYCHLAEQRQLAWQAELVLQPPDVDPVDDRYHHAMTAWAGRLKRAVQAQIVTEQKARTAWERQREPAGMGRPGRRT